MKLMSSVFVFLIRCKNPADKTVNINGNGVGTSNAFSFNMFEFAGKSSEIYLHCKLQLCVTQGKSCVPVSRAGGNPPLLM